MPTKSRIKSNNEHSELEKLTTSFANAVQAFSTFLENKRRCADIAPVNPSPITLQGQRLKRVHVSPDVFDSVQVARNAIARENTPLEIDILFNEVRARGFQINTDNPKGTYGGRLRDYSKRLNLIFLKGFGWWQSNRPYAPANYIPNPSARREDTPVEGRVALPSRLKARGKASG